jgi:hypothetical protein
MAAPVNRRPGRSVCRPRELMQIDPELLYRAELAELGAVT